MMLLAKGATEAAEVKVLCAGGIAPAVKELGAQFERASGHKLVMKVGGPVAKQEIAAGTGFDVAIWLRDVIDAAIKDGKIVVATRADIARAGVGVIVRVGAPRLDISSVDGFKRALLNAKVVHHSNEGASGVHFMGVLERLGITAEMKPKLRRGSLGDGVAAVRNGDADLAIGPIPAMMEPGVDLVGPLPAELQTYIYYVTGMGAAAKEEDVARALIKFLTAPTAGPVLKAKGMEPAIP
jgi:molybdate transport system substrate-binding protein